VKRIAEEDLREELRPNTTRRLPVWALRWSHAEINKDLCFGHNKQSIFQRADPAADILCVHPAKRDFLNSSILSMQRDDEARSSRQEQKK
jgi:hypothetical protein